MSEPPDQTVAPMSDQEVAEWRAHCDAFRDRNARYTGMEFGPLLALLARLDAAEARVAAAEDTTWFWAIADKDGLTGLPSDERAALRILVGRAARALPAPVRMETVEQVRAMQVGSYIIRRKAPWPPNELALKGRDGNWWEIASELPMAADDMVGALICGPLPDAIPSEEG